MAEGVPFAPEFCRGENMNDLEIISRFFDEGKINYYHGSLNGLKKMILSCYGEIVPESLLEKMLPVIFKDGSLIVVKGNKCDNPLVIFQR